mgnify:CR=1 FL=1
MKILFAADLHENKKSYHALFELVTRESPDILVLGGDYFRTSRSAATQLAFIEEFLAPGLVQLDVPIYFIPGNTDFPSAIERMSQLSDHVKLLDLNPVNIGAGLTLCGYGMVNVSPFRIKNYERRDVACEEYRDPKPCLMSGTGTALTEVSPYTLNQLPSIEEELQSIDGGQGAIWVMHGPPFGTKLDMISKTQHVGSRAIRAAIEKHRPLLTLHGHIHESPYVSGSWSDRLNETICVNPGSGAGLHAVSIHIEHQRILGLKHTALS